MTKVFAVRLTSLAAVLLVVSCATTPPVPREPGAAAAWLGDTPRVVVRLDAAQVTAWGKVTGSKPALKTVGARTRAVWMGFELDNLDDLSHAADTVRIVLEGDFPKGVASFMLDWDGAWTKGTIPGLWTNKALGLSVTLPEEGLVAVRRHQATLPVASPTVLRDLDPAAVEAAAAWISFWDPGQALFGNPGAKLLPVQRLDVVLASREGYLEGPVILRFADARAPRGAMVLLKLLAPQIRNRFGQDLEWSAEDTNLVGRGLRIRQDDLRALAEKLVADPPAEVNP